MITDAMLQAGGQVLSAAAPDLAKRIYEAMRALEPVEEEPPVNPPSDLTTLFETSFETGTPASLFPSINEVNSKLTIVTSPTGKAMRVSGPTSTGAQYTYSRGIIPLNWTQGKEWETEFGITLPANFWSSGGWTATFQPFGWDTWPVSGHQMRLMFDGMDGGKGRLYLKHEGQPTTNLTNEFTLPAGRPVTVKVRQLIHGVTGWTKVWIDDALVGDGYGKTWTGKPVTNMRYGWADFSGLKVAKSTDYDFIRLSHRP